MKDEITNVLRLANLVRENIRAKQLFTPSNSILVTLSGGQDSLCSLLVLYLLQNQLGLDPHAQTKTALTANSNLNLGFAQVRESEVCISIHKTARSMRTTPLLARAQLSAEHGQAEHISGLWATQPRQGNKSVRVARFTTVRSHLFSDSSPKRKVAHVQPSITCENKLPSRLGSTENRASKLEHHSRLEPPVLMPFFSQPLTEQASDRKEQPEGAIENQSLLDKSTPPKTKISGYSYFDPAIHNKTLFDFAEPSSCLDPKGPSNESPTCKLSLCESSRYRKICHSSKGRVTRVTGTTEWPFRDLVKGRYALSRDRESVSERLKKCSIFIGEFGVLWCNHFWQKESFYTMLHVAKINLCFSSTICFCLPIKNVLSEQNAREWRHKSIQRTCAFYHYDCCIQGHTKSDRVETILFNIFRGTGIAGLQSLQWKKSFSSFSCQRFFPPFSVEKGSIDLWSPLGF